jgi:hypothetical protein
MSSPKNAGSGAPRGREAYEADVRRAVEAISADSNFVDLDSISRLTRSQFLLGRVEMRGLIEGWLKAQLKVKMVNQAFVDDVLSGIEVGILAAIPKFADEVERQDGKADVTEVIGDIQIPERLSQLVRVSEDGDVFEQVFQDDDGLFEHLDEQKKIRSRRGGKFELVASVFDDDKAKTFDDAEKLLGYVKFKLKNEIAKLNSLLAKKNKQEEFGKSNIDRDFIEKDGQNFVAKFRDLDVLFDQLRDGNFFKRVRQGYKLLKGPFGEEQIFATEDEMLDHVGGLVIARVNELNTDDVQIWEGDLLPKDVEDLKVELVGTDDKESEFDFTDEKKDETLQYISQRVLDLRIATHTAEEIYDLAKKEYDSSDEVKRRENKKTNEILNQQLGVLVSEVIRIFPEVSVEDLTDNKKSMLELLF